MGEMIDAESATQISGIGYLRKGLSPDSICFLNPRMKILNRGTWRKKPFVGKKSFLG